MKIGILTHPLETNYGGVIQAFAMQKTLRNLGYEAITIDRHKHERYDSLLNHVLSFGKRLSCYYFLHRNVSPRWNPFLSDIEKEILAKNFQRFIASNIVTTEKCYPEELQSIDQKYKFDAYVVGSDQVWLPGYCPNAFLDFVKRDDVIKISYAASSGSCSFMDFPSKLEECKQLAKDFRALSARESALAQRAQDALGINVKTVIDPTFLLTKDEYLNAVDCSLEQTPILFSYILDPSSAKHNLLKYISEKCDCPIINGNVSCYYVPGGRQKIEDCVFPSIDVWISNISRAKFVVTDSFHGTALAIIFNKPFVTILNNRRGKDRFISLFEMLHISTERLLENISDFNDTLLESIDYSGINQTILLERERSLVFLKSNLKW